MSNQNPNSNKMSLDLKELMNNPEAMRNIQNMLQQNFTSDISKSKPKTKEEAREEAHRKLREKINQQSLQRQPKNVQMKEQMKMIEKNTSFMKDGLENMNVKEVVNSMVSDPKQRKRVANEFEKYIEKEKKSEEHKKE